MVDVSLQARTAAALYRRGESVNISRWTGAAGSKVQSPSGGATVTAMVANYQADTTAAAAAGYSSSQPGSITEGERFVLAMAQDLTLGSFPLPVQKGDQIILSLTSEILIVTRADPHKRAIAGAIEIFAVGVA